MYEADHTLGTEVPKLGSLQITIRKHYSRSTLLHWVFNVLGIHWRRPDRKQPAPDMVQFTIHILCELISSSIAARLSRGCCKMPPTKPKSTGSAFLSGLGLCVLMLLGI